MLNQLGFNLWANDYDQTVQVVKKIICIRLLDTKKYEYYF